MRFRLLSYVCSILLLAGMLGANLTLMNSDDWFNGIECGEYGWPLSCVFYFVGVKSLQTGQELMIRVEWPYLALNIVIGLAIPIAGLFACEFVLRRYAKGRTAKSR